MARSTPNRYPVVLSDEQRQQFADVCRNGHAPAKKIRHAQLLLLSDHGREGGPLTRTQVGELLQMHPNTVDTIRKRFVLQGEAPALNRKPRETPPVAPRLDGQSEAHLVAICCSDPPEGRVCWTMRLLADELVKRRIVTKISAETVRRTLKKTNSSPGSRSAGASPSGTAPASSRKWKTSSTSTTRSTPKTNR